MFKQNIISINQFNNKTFIIIYRVLLNCLGNYIFEIYIYINFKITHK